jgi:hypothetical protein
MATAPYQLWLDCPPIASAVRVSSTVTVTTVSTHGLVVGSVIALEGVTGTAGTSMVGAWTVATTPSGTTFTITSAGSAGTATVTTVLGSGTASQTSYSAALSQDLFAPLTDFGTAVRQQALYVPLESVQMAQSGDGSGATMSFTIRQDDTPAVGPWWTLIPDEARVRLIQKDTGSSPATDGTDVLFLGTISSLNAQLSGSGQGSQTSVQVVDSNAALDRLVVFGKPLSSKAVDNPANMVRASNVVTVTTRAAHGYGVGQKVVISGALGGGGTSFNGNFTIASTPSDYTFTFAQTGSNATAQSALSITGITREGKTGYMRVSFGVDHGLLDGQTIWIAGATTSPAGSEMENLVNNKFTGSAVTFKNPTTKVADTTRVWVRLATTPGTYRSVTATSAFMYGALNGTITITPDAMPDQGSIGINSGETETAAVAKMLGVVKANKVRDYAVNRIVNTANTSKLSATTNTNQGGITLPAGTLRSALDAIVEAYSGQDLKERRYFVDAAGRLNYNLIDTASVPTYATAPYKLITTGTQNPNTTTAAATIIPHELSLDWDYNTTKEALVLTATLDSKTSKVSPVQRVTNYVNSGYTVRPGSPAFDDIIEAPTSTQDAGAEIDRISRAFFLERHKPLLSGSFTLRGSGTQSFNQYGFNSGYAQTGASTFALVEGWRPGQFVDITCAELALSGLYRVEQVDWALEPGSFTSVVRITFNRKPPSTLTRMLNAGGAE